MLELPKSSAALSDLKPFIQIKLVVLDLDGTLVSGIDDLPGELITYLKNANRMNSVDLTVATGRTFFGARKILKELELLDVVHTSDKSPFAVVLYNGALVLNPKERAVLWHQSIGKDITMSVVKIASQNGCSAFLYHVDSSSTTAIETVYFTGAGLCPELEFNGMPVTQLHRSQGIDATTILLKVTSRTNLPLLLESLYEITAISVTSSGGEYIEITPRGVSKASGMDKWFSHPRMKYITNEVLAIGDNDNDVELLKWSGLSVAVSTASKRAKNASQYTTDYGAKRAVIEVLKVLQQAKRYGQIGEISFGK